MGSKFTKLCEIYQLSKIILYQAIVHLYSFHLLYIYIYIFLLIKNRILEKCPEKPASINTART